jgi:heptosyltransferase-2
VLPFQHGKLDWAARRRVAKPLRGRFATAYVLPNSLKSALVPWMARVPKRIGYHGEGRWLLLNERLPNPRGRPPMVAFYCALAGGPAARGDERPVLHIDPLLARDAARDAGLAVGSYWAFAPGAEYGPAKRWPTAHYAALARTLHARHGLPIALLGSGKEAPLCDEIAALAPGACQVLAGRTTLDAAMALIAGSRAMVSNDSGLMHVAAALSVPQVALFGSTSPEHTPPLNPRASVLWLKDELKLDCMPCFARECRFGHYRCLQDLPPQRVEAALHALFERA